MRTPITRPQRRIGLRYSAVLWGLLGVATSLPARAEPPLPVLYVNERTGQCGMLFSEGASAQTRPKEPGFTPFSIPTHAAECRQLLQRLAARAAADGALAPCERLQRVLWADPAHNCKALGYRYVGRVPSVSRACYPELAPYLGASCAPAIWVHGALILFAAGSVVTILLVIRSRRRQRAAAFAHSSGRGSGSTKSSHP
jgi:hypothetical protein